MYVFDLDGTLVESVEAHISAWTEALSLMGVRKGVEEIRPLMGLPAADIAKRLLPERARELALLKNKLFLDKYIALVRAYGDVDVLEKLSRPLAVVTSSSGYVARAVLEKVGLLRYIDLVLGGDEVARGKPAPDPLHVVARRLGISTRNMVVVGDSEYDMEMAKSAGACGVCITRQRTCKGGSFYISTLHELLSRSFCQGV
ncbi:MAG: HAD family hydrolase [Pyrobaculum sp.]